MTSISIIIPFYNEKLIILKVINSFMKVFLDAIIYAYDKK